MNSAPATTRIRGYAAELGHYAVDHVKWFANPRHLLDWGHGDVARHLGLRRDRKRDNP